MKLNPACSNQVFIGAYFWVKGVAWVRKRGYNVYKWHSPSKVCYVYLTVNTHRYHIQLIPGCGDKLLSKAQEGRTSKVFNS